MERIPIPANPKREGEAHTAAQRVREYVDAAGQTSVSALKACVGRFQAIRAVEAIQTVSQSVHSARQPMELYDALTHSLMEAYPDCDCCHVFTWHPQERELELKSSARRSDETPEESDFSRTAVAQVVDENKGALCVDTQSDADVSGSNSIKSLGIRSFVSAPIFENGAPVAIIYLDARHTDAALCEADLRVLCVVANEASLALRNMKLLEQYVSLQTEIQVAKRIQTSVLPKAVVVTDRFELAGRYIPCRQASGDYYDFLELPHGRWGLAVGDVSGHGVGPALLMMSTRSLLRALAGSNPDMGELMAEINDLMVLDSDLMVVDLDEQLFLSLFYGVLNPETSSLDYHSAGHEPGILLRAESGEIEQLCSTMGLLGIGDKILPQPPSTVKVQRGDVLFLATDGLCEAHNPGGDMYGREQLQDSLVRYGGRGASGIIDGMLADLMAFQGGREHMDDMTVVVVKAV